MFCVNCGAKLKEQALFCTACGTKVVMPELVTEPQQPQTVSNTPVEVEPMPVVTEPTTVVTEPVPVEAEPAPVEVEAAPVEVEAAPVEVEAAPVEAEPAPVEAEPAPVEAEAAPVEAEPAPVEAEPAPVEVEAAPVEAEPAPVEAEPAPVEVEPAPVAAEPAPVAAEPVPVAAEPAPVAAEPAAKKEKAKREPKPKKEKAPKKQKEYTPRRKPHIAVRILLQLLSLVLCLVLAASLVVTVVLADLNHLMSEGGIKQLINAVLIPSSAPHRVTPAVGALGVSLDDASGVQLPGNVDLNDIPKDLLTGGSAEENISNIIDWVYEKMEESSTEPLTFTKEQVEEFVTESTVADYMAEKLAAYADDFINGTENTTITADEIMDLIEENEDLIEDTFEVRLTSDMKKVMKKNVVKVVEDNDLNTVIREQVFETVENTIDNSVESVGMNWEDIQSLLKVICSDVTLYIAIGVCVLLMLLLCWVNYYNVPGGLTWIAVPSILFGGIMTLPLVLPEMLAIVGVPDAVVSLIGSFAGVLLPIHGIVPLVGLGLLVISIFWRVIRSAVNRKRARAAMA